MNMQEMIYKKTGMKNRGFALVTTELGGRWRNEYPLNPLLAASLWIGMILVFLKVIAPL